MRVRKTVRAFTLTNILYLTYITDLWEVEGDEESDEDGDLHLLELGEEEQQVNSVGSGDEGARWGAGVGLWEVEGDEESVLGEEEQQVSSSEEGEGESDGDGGSTGAVEISHTQVYGLSWWGGTLSKQPHMEEMEQRGLTVLEHTVPTEV